MSLMVPTAIAAAVVGWLGLRRTPPNWIVMACAYAILFSPFVYAIVEWSADGFQLAMMVAGFTALTPIVGVALTAGALYKRERAKYVPDRSPGDRGGVRDRGTSLLAGSSAAGPGWR